jgi:hypothetical protein
MQHSRCMHVTHSITSIVELGQVFSSKFGCSAMLHSKSMAYVQPVLELNSVMSSTLNFVV